MASESDSPVWRRIRAAAILAGYRGPEQLFDALDVGQLSFSNARRIVRGEIRVRPAWSVPEIAGLIEQHCASERGVRVPAEWILNGFGEV